MIKRLVAIGGATALLLGAAIPVFANGGNIAIIKDNDTTAVANTGANTQDNYGGNLALAGKGSDNTATVDSSGSRSMTTGDASAKAKLVVVANTNVGCGCDENNDNGFNLAVVKKNDTYAEANTGVNYQDNYEGNTAIAGKGSGNQATVDSSGSRTMTTGNATAKAKTWIVVNSNISW